MKKHQIIFDAETDVPEGIYDELERVILAAMEEEHVELPCEINVLLTDDEGIRQINLDMRGVDRPTDVL
ncbi:MAG: rRNA maturation RNAse YbeY, partial [Lawsonibacter sp.]|nr:rRNA maturation RNAse YbeY [Lawsonibacter sp.]